MDKEKIKKVTLNDFIKKAVDKQSNKKMEADIPILDYGEITFKRPTNDQMLEYMNISMNAVKMDKDRNVISTDYASLNEAAKQFIYFTCPFLQNQELQDSLGVKDPFDTPVEAFGIENIAGIATQIQNEFRDKKRVKEEIKNS